MYLVNFCFKTTDKTLHSQYYGVFSMLRLLNVFAECSKLERTLVMSAYSTAYKPNTDKQGVGGKGVTVMCTEKAHGEED